MGRNARLRSVFLLVFETSTQNDLWGQIITWGWENCIPTIMTLSNFFLMMIHQTSGAVKTSTAWWGAQIGPGQMVTNEWTMRGRRKWWFHVSKEAKESYQGGLALVGPDSSLFSWSSIWWWWWWCGMWDAWGRGERDPQLIFRHTKTRRCCSDTWLKSLFLLMIWECYQ